MCFLHFLMELRVLFDGFLMEMMELRVFFVKIDGIACVF